MYEKGKIVPRENLDIYGNYNACRVMYASGDHCMPVQNNVSTVADLAMVPCVPWSPPFSATYIPIQVGHISTDSRIAAAMPRYVYRSTSSARARVFHAWNEDAPKMPKLSFVLYD